MRFLDQGVLARKPVIPAKAGIQRFHRDQKLDPGPRRDDGK
jgi:hypothetical protein